MKHAWRLLAIWVLGLVCSTSPARAAEIVPSGSAEVALPQSEPVFRGKIGRIVADSVADFPAPLSAPKGAPNILLVMTDDVGFGASSTFGGPIPTPNLDRLAARGLRYNTFNTTAICSPSRAALLTGRNHHSVGVATVTELAVGFPGYTSAIPKSAGTVAETLRQNGYNTAMFGKHHNVPVWELSQNGPYDHWPTGLGFQYFYGFLAFGTNQWAPALYENTQPVEPPLSDPNYHFDRDMADHAIRWIDQQKSLSPDRPFFVYYAPGTAHAPHHAPREWIEKFRGQFDQGWDRVREETFARQKAEGVIPASTLLTPRPVGLLAWDGLTGDQKRVYARMMEVYAASLAHMDEQFGRVLDELQRIGQIDNTLVIFIQGDNGASAEGTLQGSTNETGTLIDGSIEDMPYLTGMLDQLGGPNTYGHYPAGWAWAMDSPFQWTKQIASHFGGIRNGLVMSWPQRLRGDGAVRPQFHHLIDVMPTIFEAAGVRAPTVLNGVKQKPVEGISMLYTLTQKSGFGQRQTQYFEQMGNRGIYHDGWFANTTPKRAPWTPGVVIAGDPADGYDWELYDLHRDFSQATNLAGAEPARLEAMKTLWWEEAETHQVLPIDDSFITRLRPGSHPDFLNGRKQFTYWGPQSRIQSSVAPELQNHSFAITADITVPPGGVEGVVATWGGRFGGWAFTIEQGRPVVHHALSQQPRHQFAVVANTGVPTGTVVLRYEFALDQLAAVSRHGIAGPGGTLRILANGQLLGEGRIPQTFIGHASGDEGLDIGLDTGTPVGVSYALPFRFNGVIRRLSVELL